MVYSAIYISSYWCRMHHMPLPNHIPTSIHNKQPNLLYTEGQCKMNYTEGQCKTDFGL